MKLSNIFLICAGAANARIMIGHFAPSAKIPSSTEGSKGIRQEGAVTSAGTNCCDIMEGSPINQFRDSSLFKLTGETFNDRQVWADDYNDFLFFNQKLGLWVINSELTNDGRGKAFNQDGECPTSVRAWTTLNNKQWVPNPKFLVCTSISEQEHAALKLADRVCTIIKQAETRIPLSNYFKRTSNLCNRARNLAKRTVRDRPCSNDDGIGRSLFIISAVDTVQQWRDSLVRINKERNSQCRIGNTLEDAIEKYYNLVLHLFSKAQADY